MLKRKAGCVFILVIVLGYWVAVDRSYAQEVAFLPARAVPAGGSPNAVAIGDFNGDGFPDLAVANGLGAHSVAILLGNGDGDFGSPQAFGVDGIPLFVAVADFNLDDIPDLVTSNTTSQGGVVSVMIGRGDGTFLPAQSTPVGGYPRSLTVADFDGDGIPDVATANDSANTVVVLLGIGDGTWAPARTLAVASGPRSITSGDFDGDGFIDLAVAHYGPGIGSEFVAILQGNGDGTFVPMGRFGAGVAPVCVLAADFNEDGLVDLVVANYVDPGTVTVLIGNGDGTFQPARGFRVNTRVSWVAAGDFNGDGHLDLAATDWGVQIRLPGVSVYVLLGDGQGGFQSDSSYRVGLFPEFVTVGDLNGDALPDLVVTWYNTTNVAVLINSTSLAGRRP